MSTEKNNQTILIVDDAPDLRDMLSEMLEMKGYVVLTAHNGESGLACALDTHPDLIMLDLRMPDMSGFDVLRCVREDTAWGKDVPVLMITASGDHDDIPDDLPIKKEDFLLKTEWDLGDIINKIQEKLHETNPV